MRKKIPFGLTGKQRLAIIQAMRQVAPPISDTQIGQVFGISRQAIHQLAGERPSEPRTAVLQAALTQLLDGRRLAEVARGLDLSPSTLRKQILADQGLPANFWLTARLARERRHYLAVRAELLEFAQTAQTPAGQPLPLTANYLRAWDRKTYNRAVAIQSLPAWRVDLGLPKLDGRSHYPPVPRGRKRKL